jgi:predicted anti-sigma-YlaC factor YlaD
MERETSNTRRRNMKGSKYTMAKLMMAILVVGLLTLNGCMLKKVFSDDEGMGHDGGMQHGMMHSSDDE